jgi:Flp pilus assembly protein TadD
MPHDSAYLAELALLIARYDARFGDRRGDLPATIELPDDQGASHAMGRAEKLLLAEKFEEGLATLEDEKLAPRRPTSERPSLEQALWLRLRGFAFFRLKRFDDAALSFAAAVAAEPLDPWYVSGAGQSFLFRGDAESAVACLRRVQPVGPDDFAAFFHLGLAYGRLGMMGEARRALRTGFREFFVDTLEVSLQPMVREILGAAADRAFSATLRM